MADDKPELRADRRAGRARGGAQPPRRRQPRARSLPGLLLAGLLALLAVSLGLAALLLLGLQLQPGRDLLRDLLVAELSGPDFALEIGSIEGAPPGLVRIEDLALADSQGVWLTADRLLLDWSPLALAGGTLDVQALTAGRVEVRRAPVSEAPAEPEPEGGFALPTLPLALELQHLAVERLALAEPVLGEPLALSLEAALAAERDGVVESRLAIEETGGEGSVTGHAVYRQADGTLEVSLEAAAPAGGRVSRLSELPGAPALSLSLQGSGPLPGWRGRLQADAGRVASLQGNLGVDSLEPVALALEATLSPGPQFPAEAAAWVQPVLKIGLAARYDAAEETAALTVQELSSEAFDLDGQAAADLGEDRAEARLSLALGDSGPLRALVPGLELDGGRIEASASKRGDEASLSLQAEIERPFLAGTGEAPGFGFEGVVLNAAAEGLDLAAPLSGDQPLQLGATLRGPLGDPALGDLLAETTELRLAVLPQDQALTIQELTLDSGSLGLAGGGRYVLEGPEAGAARLQATLREGELSRFSRLAGLALGGRATLTLDGAMGPDGGGRVTAALRPEALSLGQPAAQALLGESPVLTLEAERAADGPIRLLGADLVATAVETADGPLEPLRLHAEGHLSLEDEQLDATASLALPRLAVLQSANVPVSGAATLDLTAFGPLDALQAVWALRGEQLSYQGTAIPRLALDGTTSGLPERPSGQVELSATSPAGPLTGGFDYAVEGEVARIEQLRLSRGADSLTGALAARLDSGTAEGALTLSLTDLGAYADLLGQRLAGSLSAKVSLRAPEGRQEATLSATASDLALDGLRVADAALQASGRNLTGEPRLQAEATVSGLVAGEVALNQVKAEVAGGLERLTAELSLAGRALSRDLAATAAAEIALEAATRVRLTALEASLGAERLALQQPAVLLLGGNRTEVQDLSLTLAGAQIALDAELRPGRVDADLSIRGLPVRLVELVAPDLEPQGRIDLTARLSGTPPQPDGSLSLSATGLKMSPVAGEEVPPLALDLEGRLAGGRLSLTGEAGGFAETPLTLRAELPLLVTTTPVSVNLPDDRPLSLQADWQGQLEQVMAVLPIDAVRFGGRAAVDLDVEGTLAEPQTAGSVSVEEGFYQNYLLGMQLQPVTLQLSGRGRRLELERFSGRDSEGGTMNAQGFVDLSGPAPRFDLTFTADNAHIAQRDDVRGAVDANFTLKGTTEGASLKGRLRTRQTEVRLIDALPPSVTELQVVEVDGGAPPPEDAEAQAEEEEQGGIEGMRWLALDVEIAIPGQLFVRGRGLDSEWRGSLQVAGTAEQPRILGQLSPVRGSFDFAGRVFTLSPQSTIQFLGGTDPNPELDLTATYQESDFSASIQIYGPVSDPKFDLTSTPALPEDEILARVLFGKSSGQLSAAEAVQLAQAAQTLRGGGEGLMDIARRTLGVDVLSFAPGDSGSDVGSLRIGKYVTDDVFIGAEQGTSPGSSTAIVEWELTPNITVESEVGADSRSNASINWKWDY